MDAPKSLKETHPQKYYLKIVCKFIYWLGIGDCWYERTEKSKIHKAVFAVWAVIFNAYLILGTFNEVLANLRTDLTLREKNDLIQFTFAHPLLSAKYIFLILQKDRVKVLFKRLLEGTRTIFSSPQVDRESVRKAIMYSASAFFITYGTLIMANIDGIRAYFQEGIPIRTEVVYYPTRFDSGTWVNILRFFVELHWYSIVANMCFVDTLSIFSMVFLGYKFRLVRIFFNSIRTKIEKNRGKKSTMALREEFMKDFIVGMQLHEDALWCAKNVQYALGNIYSVQVVESIALLVMCLVRLVSGDRNLISMLSIFTYITCLFILTGAYFTAAGDVTFEASELTESIFYCGWELVGAGSDIRPLVVVAIQRSQVPVYMTAFGVLSLSYNNFISFMRSSYSFFAVMY